MKHKLKMPIAWVNKQTCMRMDFMVICNEFSDGFKHRQIVYYNTVFFFVLHTCIWFKASTEHFNVDN